MNLTFTKDGKANILSIDGVDEDNMECSCEIINGIWFLHDISVSVDFILVMPNEKTIILMDYADEFYSYTFVRS